MTTKPSSCRELRFEVEQILRRFAYDVLHGIYGGSTPDVEQYVEQVIAAAARQSPGAQ